MAVERSVAEEIAELRGLDVPARVARYQSGYGKPPRVKHRDWLWRRCAWKVQEQRFGGLSQVARRRVDELIAEMDLPLGNGRTVREKLNGARSRGRDPVLGTSVSRVWKGREVRATRVDGGWEHDGVVRRSLSAVAQAITGSHWNGKLFFGLTERRRAKS
jgi:hypothetical protein